MWGGDGAWFVGGAREDATWEGGGGETELGFHAPWRGTANVLDRLPDRGMTVEFPGLGLPMTPNDEDGNAGTFSPPACPGYCGHFGGWNPPPPTVPLIQHAGLLTCPEQEAPCHHPVRQGGRVETKAAGGRGTVGDLREGLSGL